MFATLRRIHQRQDAPLSSSPLGLEQSQLTQLRRSVYDKISLSEHHLVRFHEEREKEVSGGIISGEQRPTERRKRDFFTRVLQNHFRAIAHEEAVLASARCNQQGRACSGVTERPSKDLMMANEEDFAQLLWMNRTMALGATYTALESSAEQRSRGRVSMVARQQQGEDRERRSPGLDETICFLRASFPALRVILVTMPSPPVASVRASLRIAKRVISREEDLGATQNRGLLCHDDTKVVDFLQPQPEEYTNSSVQELQSSKRPVSFTVKVHEGLLQVQQHQKQSDLNQPVGVACGSDFTLHGRTSNAKHQTTLNVDSRGKLSLAQPTPSPANLLDIAFTSSNTAAGSSCGGDDYGVPSNPIQGVLPPSFTSTRKPQQTPGVYFANDGANSFAAADGIADAANVRQSRRGSRGLLTKRLRDEEEGGGGDGANSSIEGGHNSSGFITAGERLAADVRAGRAMPTSIPRQHRTPALGLRRSGFTPPFQQQQQRQFSPPPPSLKSDGAGGVSGALVPVGDVLSSISGNKKGLAESKRGTHGGSGNRNNKNGEREGSDASERGEFPASLLLDGSVPPILQPLDPKLVAQVAMEILEHGAGAANVGWDDIAGLEHAKRSVEEAIVWPLRRPDLFVGLRDPPRGLLLFGPPGTGKTMIARAIANRAQCTFLNISASSLMSKWMGDGEKLVRCLFAVATVKQPSVIFIDEIDSLLSVRGEGEMDSVRRVKTEFLVQLDGVATDRGDRVLLIGATNRPDELDEAARRRMEKRLYIPLPDASARVELIKRLLHSMDVQYLQQRVETEAVQTDGMGANVVHSIDEQSIADIAAATDGYSGADIKQVCREAAMGPLREVTLRLTDVALSELRPIQRRDFMQALKRIRPSVGASEVARYLEWNKQFGSFSPQGEEEAAEEEEQLGKLQ